jgi:hypothetical protein
MLPLIALAAVLAFAASLAAAASAELPRAVAVHLALATGALPLILAAMLHFVPVLTRSRAAARGLFVLPLAALGTGLGVAVHFAFDVGIGRTALALAALAIILAMLAWTLLRWRRALGAPHPCLYWYVAAQGCLALALAVVALGAQLPEHALGLRHAHLHLNALGFVGLTALGTLQVLMPTVAGAADARAAARLRALLPVACGGVLLVAFSPWIGRFAAGAGALLLLAAVARIAWAWQHGLRAARLRRDGAAPALALALAGWTLALVAGAAHGLGGLDPDGAAAGFVVAFLLPLVSGALTHLLPLWLAPRAPRAWQVQARERLGRYAALRALAFVVAGTGLTLGQAAAIGLAAAALLQFGIVCALVSLAAIGAARSV